MRDLNGRIIRWVDFDYFPIAESSHPILAGSDGRTADAEHRRRPPPHQYVAYVPPSNPYARFPLSPISESMATETRGHWIHGRDFGGLGGMECASGVIPQSWGPGFLHFTCVGIGLGELNPAYQLRGVRVGCS